MEATLVVEIFPSSFCDDLSWEAGGGGGNGKQKASWQCETLRNIIGERKLRNKRRGCEEEGNWKAGIEHHHLSGLKVFLSPLQEWRFMQRLKSTTFLKSVHHFPVTIKRTVCPYMLCHPCNKKIVFINVETQGNIFENVSAIFSTLLKHLKLKTNSNIRIQNSYDQNSYDLKYMCLLR